MAKINVHGAAALYFPASNTIAAIKYGSLTTKNGFATHPPAVKDTGLIDYPAEEGGPCRGIIVRLYNGKLNRLVFASLFYWFY